MVLKLRSGFFFEQADSKYQIDLMSVRNVKDLFH